MISKIENNQLKSYFFVTFLITWVFFFLPLLLNIEDPVSSLLIIVIGGSGPALAAIILSAILNPKKLENQQRKRWTVFLIALIITIILIISYLQIALIALSLLQLILIIIVASIAAYIISGGLAIHEGIRELLNKLYVWKLGLKWYGVVLILYPAIMFLSILIGILATGSSINELYSSIFQINLLWLIISFAYIGLVRGPLREEIGWRGFALPRLQNLYSPLIGTLILALIWTVWHFPLHVNGIYPGGLAGFFNRFYWNIPLTFILTWIYNHTRGSLLLTTLFHTSVNTMGTLLIIPSAIVIPQSLAFLILVNFTAIVVIIADKMWRKLPEDSPAVYKY